MLGPEGAAPHEAAFVVGRLTVDDSSAVVDVGAVWNLLNALGFPVPLLEEAKEWEHTILEWRTHDVAVPAYSVTSVVDIVRETRSIAGLGAKLGKNRSQTIAWLCSLLDLLSATI